MCYWMSQGRCTLSYLPCESVLEILHTVPQAREDLLKCTSCLPIEPLYIEYAERVGLIRDPLEISDEYQKHINKYVDNTQHWPGVRKP